MYTRLLLLCLLSSVPGLFSERTVRRTLSEHKDQRALLREILPELKLDQILQAKGIRNVRRNPPPDEIALAAGDPDPLPDKTLADDTPVAKPPPQPHETNTTPSGGNHPTPQAHQSGNNAGGSGSNVATIKDVYIIGVIAGCSVAGVIGLTVAGVCWYKLQKRVKAARDVEYPAYGVTGPNKDRAVPVGDRKLAQSAQMYHYQHQKQQMIAMEKATGDMKPDGSDDESEDEENIEGDYTVYECPGLAPTGEMEVKNPLFMDETPAAAPGAAGLQSPKSETAESISDQ